MHPVIQETIDYIGKQVPVAGGAVLSFRNGETVEKSVFGLQDREAGIPVTEETLFQIASMSKSFCTVLISMLEDEGLLHWDDPVKKYWPEYHAYNDYVTEHMTLRDLACHRSGVCSHNKQRYSMFDDQCRDLYLASKRTLDLAPCFDFRDRFAYQNEMYAILGYLSERVTGKTYEELLREKIGAPLGIELQFRNYRNENETRYAVGYDTVGQELRRVDPASCAPITNCPGGVVTNLNGVEKWIKFLASRGVAPDGTRLLSEKGFKNLIKPILFWGDPYAPDRSKQYALGLAPSVYRGEVLVYHGGVLFGYRSAMGFFRDLNSGYAVMINSTSQPYSILKDVLLDIALDRVEPDYHAEADKRIRAFLTTPDFEANCLPKTDVREEDLQTYAFNGTFENPAYGDMTFEYVGENRLKLSYYRDDDEYLFYRGNGVFQKAGNPMTDVRYRDGGNTLVFSKGEFYSPNLFTRK